MAARPGDRPGQGLELGLDREAVAIAARYRRQSAAWAPHLDATRQLIRDAAAACPGRGTALVLGTGPCLDVPLAALAARFASVVLVDLHHPRSVRRLVRSRPGVRLVEADLTGLAPMALATARGRAGLPRPVPVPDLSFGLRPDFTVSANLASQLPIPLARLLRRRLTEPVLDALGQELIAAHFAALARLPGRVCLVCDASWQLVEDGRITAMTDILEGLRPPLPDRTWTWDIAPRPEASFCADRRNLVWGWLDFKASLAAQAAAAGEKIKREDARRPGVGRGGEEASGGRGAKRKMPPAAGGMIPPDPCDGKQGVRKFSRDGENTVGR